MRTTISDPAHPNAENVPKRTYTAEKLNTCWTTDITVIDTDERHLYLAALEGIFSHKIVG